MLCSVCKGHGSVVNAFVPPECGLLVPEIQEPLPDGSIVLHYRNGLTGVVSFPMCPRCRGAGQARRLLGWRWVDRWAQRVGFRFPPIRRTDLRGVVWRRGQAHEGDEISGEL